MTSPNPGQGIPQFATPSNYPSRATNDLILSISRDVMQGASIRDAALAYGVTMGKLRNWMKWGAEAAERDRGPEDSQAIYLAFYLAVSQSAGRARVAAGQLLMFRDPAKWLAMNPDSRADWGANSAAGNLLDPSGEVVEEASTLSPPLGAEGAQHTREMLHYMIDAGAHKRPTKEEGEGYEDMTGPANESAVS